MSRIYSVLLRLYPPEYRELFGDEMLALLEEASADERGRGRTRFLWFTLRELVGLARGGGFESMAKCGRSRQYLNFMPSGTERVEFLIRRMEYAIAHHQFAQARYYAEEERREREKFQKRSD